MGEKEDREKAEKLAAAKKRVAQLQKKKKAAAITGEKSTSKGKASKDDTPKSPTKGSSSAAVEEEHEEDKEKQPPADADEAEFNDVIQAAQTRPVETDLDTKEDAPQSPTDEVGDDETLTNGKNRATGPRERQPSMSVQSKLRSTSFRQTTTSFSPTSPIPFSPDDDSAPEIHRRQSLRLEELERQNRALAKEAADHEARWRKTEAELEDLREKELDRETSLQSQMGKVTEHEAEITKLRAQLGSLTLQRSRAQSTSKTPRPTGIPDSTSPDSLRAELETKSATITDMELEISRLRSQLSSQSQGCDAHGEQIAALQSSLASAEAKSKSQSGELADTKKALSRAAEKAMLDGTERTSKDTKLRALERELAAAATVRDDVVRKAELLEKKVEAMTKLHREAEARAAQKLGVAETASREAGVLKARLAAAENENGRLKDAAERRRKRSMSGGAGSTEDLDELEDEERRKLEQRIRDLEAEVFDLKRGVWRDRRKDLQTAGGDGEGAEGAQRGSMDVGEGFDEVDLSGAGSSRRRSLASNALLGGSSHQPPAKHSGFSQVLNSGFAAFRGATASPGNQHQPGRGRNDSLLQEFDGDDVDDGAAGFDEHAFAQAQREEEARRMVEHVREVKRGLKRWVGFRLDLVDSRRGEAAGGAFGEIFDV